MVLVILAILAAILVPALLGWIDEARNKQYVLEARNIYIAAQAVADEAYASKAVDGTTVTLLSYIQKEYDRIKKMSDLTALTITSVANSTGSYTGTDHSNYVIAGMEVTFTSQDGTAVEAKLADGTWKITKLTPKTT